MSRLHHIALGTANVERLATFYRDVLQLPELTRHLFEDGRVRSIWLALGDAILMLEASDGAAPAPPPNSAGGFLLAFRVGPEERLTLEQALESAGCPVEKRTQFSSYTRDMDGNRIAISHHPHARPL